MPNNFLIVLAGPPCSGKSAVAAELERRLKAPSLSMDATRRRILPGAAHTREDRRVAYRAMNLAAECVIRSGGSIILDAPYGHAEDREDLRSLVEPAQARVYLVEFRVSAETAVRRLRARGPDPDRPDLTELSVTQAAREYSYTGMGLVLNSDVLSPAEAAERISGWVNTPGSPSSGMGPSSDRR